MISIIGMKTPIPKISKNIVTIEENNITTILFFGTPQELRTLKIFLELLTNYLFN